MAHLYTITHRRERKKKKNLRKINAKEKRMFYCEKSCLDRMKTHWRWSARMWCFPTKRRACAFVDFVFQNKYHYIYIYICAMKVDKGVTRYVLFGKKWVKRIWRICRRGWFWGSALCSVCLKCIYIYVKCCSDDTSVLCMLLFFGFFFLSFEMKVNIYGFCCTNSCSQEWEL